jgi:hypothetical protein
MTSPCIGTGTDGPRVQLAYWVTGGATDQYATRVPEIIDMAQQIDNWLETELTPWNHHRVTRWMRPSCGQPSVLHATDTNGVTFDAPGVHYLVWVDGNTAGVCGFATESSDDASSPANANNWDNAIGEIRTECGITLGVALHEYMHMMGAVQATAPHSNNNGGFHCYEEWDIMCYHDAPNAPALVYTCPSAPNETLDCNNDDYFSGNEPRGVDPPVPYIIDHWNTYHSNYLADPNITPSMSCGDCDMHRGGETQTITFSGYHNGETVYVFVDGKNKGHASANTSGAGSLTITFGANAATGTFPIAAIGYLGTWDDGTGTLRVRV